MRQRIKLRSLLPAMALVLCAGLFLLAASPAVAGSKAYFIDMLYLNEGKTPADAKKYFSNTGPIVSKHGLRRVLPGFVVTEKMSGNIEPDLINVWEVVDPENTFDAIFADPAYLENVPLRDATFDMSRSHMFMMKEAG